MKRIKTIQNRHQGICMSYFRKVAPGWWRNHTAKTMAWIFTQLIGKGNAIGSRFITLNNSIKLCFINSLST